MYRRGEVCCHGFCGPNCISKASVLFPVVILAQQIFERLCSKCKRISQTIKINTQSLEFCNIIGVVLFLGQVNACHPNPCQNGGACVNSGCNNYKCNCPPAWAGRNCQIGQFRNLLNAQLLLRHSLMRIKRKC